MQAGRNRRRVTHVLALRVSTSNQVLRAPPVRSFAITLTRHPAPADLEPSAPPVGVGVAVEAGQAHADAVCFTLGVGLRVVLGVAVTGADGFAYAIAVRFGNPGTVAVCLASPRGNVAAVGPD